MRIKLLIAFCVCFVLLSVVLTPAVKACCDPPCNDCQNCVEDVCQKKPGVDCDVTLDCPHGGEGCETCEECYCIDDDSLCPSNPPVEVFRCENGTCVCQGLDESCDWHVDCCGYTWCVDNKCVDCISQEDCAECEECVGNDCQVPYDKCDEEDDCGPCQICSDCECEDVTTCYHIEYFEQESEGECVCNYSTEICGGNILDYSIPTAVSGGPGYCKKKQTVRSIGVNYSCMEGGADATGILYCFTVNATALLECAVQCGAGAYNCYMVLFGAGDPAQCAMDYPDCYECITGLELDDCGCIPHICIQGYPVGQEYDDADTLYGGACD